MPDIREDCLEDQLIFGDPEEPGTAVTYSKSYSFDSYLQNVSPTPALLHLHDSTHSNHGSLSTSFSSEIDNTIKPKHTSKDISLRIKEQSIKQLDIWKKVSSHINPEEFIIDRQVMHGNVQYLFLSHNRLENTMLLS